MANPRPRCPTPRSSSSKQPQWTRPLTRGATLSNELFPTCLPRHHHRHPESGRTIGSCSISTCRPHNLQSDAEIQQGSCKSPGGHPTCAKSCIDAGRAARAAQNSLPTKPRTRPHRHFARGRLVRSSAGRPDRVCRQDWPIHHLQRRDDRLQESGQHHRGPHGRTQPDRSLNP